MSLPYRRVQFMPGAGPFDQPGDYRLELTGAAGSRASTPDDNALDVTDLSGAIELRAPVGLPTVGLGYELISKYVNAGNQRSWHIRLHPAGSVTLFWSADGTNVLQANSGAPLPRPLVGSLTVGWHLDVNNGAGGRTITFYARQGDLAGLLANLGTSVLGTPIVQAGTTSVFNSTAPLDIGDLSGTADPAYVGVVRRAQVRNGDLSTGTIVANPDFTLQTPGTTNFSDSATRSWTVNPPAAIVGYDWVTIPGQKVRLPLSWDDGRSNELDQFRSATATVHIKNNDRHFDPEHTTGPYFGKLNPRTPFRIQLSTDGTAWVDQYYGFVKDGWRQSYAKPSVSTCTVELGDLLGVLESEPLPRTAYELTVVGDAARAYWTLDETGGTQMADSSGYGRHGIYDNGLLGEDPLITGDGRALACPNPGESRGRWSGEGLPEGPPCTLEAWIRTPRDLLRVKSIIVAQRDTSLGSALWMKVDSSAGAPNGQLTIHFHGLGGYKAYGHVRCDDDRPHHVVCTIADNTTAGVLLYVDGVLQTKTTATAGSVLNWTDLLAWTVGNTIDNGVGDYGLDGIIDEAAVYDSVLTASQIQDHYTAGSTGFSGEFSGARINRVLDFIGVPASLRDVAAGDSTVGPAEYGGDSAGSYLQKVVESEQGVLYVDHRNGGKLKFRGRYARLTETRSKTSQTTFTPKHFREDVVPEPNGVETVVNVAEVTWRGGKEVVSDDTSRRRFGAQARSLNTEAPTAAAAQNAGNWLIARYKDPQVRLRHLPLNLAGKPNLWSKILDLRISDRITVQRHPQQVGASVSNELIVEGVRHSLNEDRSWTVDYRLSNADDAQVWIWGTSAWGVDAAWG